MADAGAGEHYGSAPSIEWRKTALLVVDMQNDFIYAGPLCVSGGIAIMPVVNKAVSLAREKGALVVWVKREHDLSGRDVELFRTHLYGGELVGPTVKGTPGAALVEGLDVLPQDLVLVKYRFSAFFDTNLDRVLRRQGVVNIVVAGVQTPNCIRATAFDALALDYLSVTVLADATAAANPEIHAANLLDLRNVGIKTPSIHEWVKDEPPVVRGVV
eukprot:TRINITY_DN1377_c0_g1_i4.p1 TRINITY_DN1377_c0_g1~~TRINITY_DN1377_c0_g1_i4.p1  ORF type:complete len:215 (-),score=33.74 TRINITY_DN1377_c0_g1_i4:285-929(-)